MKYLLIILSVIFLNSCCSTDTVKVREEIKYTYKDSINYVLKADSIKVVDSVPIPYFLPYIASVATVNKRVVKHSDGTYKDKYDSLQVQYNMLDSTFNVVINSSPDTVYKTIVTEKVKDTLFDTVKDMFILLNFLCLLYLLINYIKNK